MAAPVADAITTPVVDVTGDVAVSDGLLTVDAAFVVEEVAFQPVGCIDVVALWAYVRVLVMVIVVEYEDVTVTVVSPDQSPGGRSARAAGASRRATAAVIAVKRMVMRQTGICTMSAQ